MLSGGSVRYRLYARQGLGAAEFADVRATAEHLASADDHHGLHSGIGLGLLDALDDAGACALSQTVDGGVVQRDDGHAVGDLVGSAHGDLVDRKQAAETG